MREGPKRRWDDYTVCYYNGSQVRGTRYESVYWIHLKTDCVVGDHVHTRRRKNLEAHLVQDTVPWLARESTVTNVLAS